jgi:hypothetical protein
MVSLPDGGVNAGRVPEGCRKGAGRVPCRKGAFASRLRFGEGGAGSNILDAVRSYATVGEICDALRDVFGAYTETSVL